MSSFENQTIVFTGVLSKPRHFFEDIVTSRGGKVGSSVTRNTSFLVMGTTPGSKYAKAKYIGIPIIDEETFMSKIGDISEDEETPLSPEELKTIEAELITYKCKWCGNNYRQWKTQPDYETCHVCNLRTYISCPYCDNTYVAFIEDFKLYRCGICNTWFDAPFTDKVPHIKHRHMFIETKRDDFLIHKICPCGKKCTITFQDEHNYKIARNNAPNLVKEIKINEARREKAREETAYKNWFDNLTESQKQDLIIQVERQQKLNE